MGSAPSAPPGSGGRGPDPAFVPRPGAEEGPAGDRPHGAAGADPRLRKLCKGEGVAMALTRVISGGQTGAAQAGLHAARRGGLPTGGWAPRGWLVENGTAP